MKHKRRLSKKRRSSKKRRNSKETKKGKLARYFRSSEHGDLFHVVDNDMYVHADDLQLNLEDIPNDGIWDVVLGETVKRPSAETLSIVSMDLAHRNIMKVRDRVYEGGDPFLILCDIVLQHRFVQKMEGLGDFFDCSVAAREYMRICTGYKSLKYFVMFTTYDIYELMKRVKELATCELLCYCHFEDPLEPHDLLHAVTIHTNPESNTHRDLGRLRIVFSNQCEYDIAYPAFGITGGLYEIPYHLQENWRTIGLPYKRDKTWSEDFDGTQLRHFLTNINECTYLHPAYKPISKMTLFKARVWILNDTKK
jgi:hypothetical protein